jgi:hypothetical protein
MQVFPGAWTAVLVFLDNPGIWNLRVENLDSWYLGQELYISVVNPEEDHRAKTGLPLPDNTIFCGALSSLQRYIRVLYCSWGGNVVDAEENDMRIMLGLLAAEINLIGSSTRELHGPGRWRLRWRF